MPFAISELKEHNSELLKLLTENLPDMMWVKDLDGNYLYANQAICDGLLMAKDIAEPIGKNDIFFAKRERESHKNIPDWHTFGELCANSDQLIIGKNKAMKIEEYGNVQGKLLYLEVYKAPFYDKNGDIIGTVGAGRDITELKTTQLDLEAKNKMLAEQQKKIESFNSELEKRVEEEIVKQQTQERLMIHQSRQAAMGEMLESIAHQWRQPLNIIGIATANLETQYLIGSMTAEDFHNKMEIVASNINYMSSTIDDFRNFLNPSREMLHFNVEKSIQNILSILSAQIRSNDINYTVEKNDDLSFYGVENEFKQVILIVLNNAFEAMKIAMQNKDIDSGKITIVLTRKDNVGVIEITDNGGGIDDAIIESVFNPYFTTKGDSNGTGIGLYIAKKIVENRMQGSISVINVDKGCCFKIAIAL